MQSVSTVYLMSFFSDSFHDKDKLKEVFLKVSDLNLSSNVHCQISNDHVTLLWLLEDHGSCLVEKYPSGLITLKHTVHEYGRSLNPFRFLTAFKDIEQHLNSTKSKYLPGIRLGDPVDCYWPTSTGCLVEYDFDEYLVNERSNFQDVKIANSKQYGRVLLLDGDVNLAESDLAYTRAITGNDRYNFDGSDVLVLGGGDGGILHYLLQKNVKFVTMLEIDPVVIDGAKRFMRRCCGDSMDNLKGERYEVLVEDCVPLLKKYIEDGRQFDFVVNDLTAIPIGGENSNDWDFFLRILNDSLTLLSPNGRYFTQGNGFNRVKDLQRYEHMILNELQFKLSFKKENVCVPSYLEMWVFYEIWKS